MLSIAAYSNDVDLTFFNIWSHTNRLNFHIIPSISKCTAYMLAVMIMSMIEHACITNILILINMKGSSL